MTEHAGDNLKKVYAHLDLAANAITEARDSYAGDDEVLRRRLADLSDEADAIALLVELTAYPGQEEEPPPD